MSCRNTYIALTRRLQEEELEIHITVIMTDGLPEHMKQSELIGKIIYERFRWTISFS